MERDLRDFINNIEDAAKRKDCKTLLEIMEEESGYKATLKGQIIGFGMHHYKYESGRKETGSLLGLLRERRISVFT